MAATEARVGHTTWSTYPTGSPVRAPPASGTSVLFSSLPVAHRVFTGNALGIRLQFTKNFKHL